MSRICVIHGNPEAEPFFSLGITDISPIKMQQNAYQGKQEALTLP